MTPSSKPEFPPLLCVGFHPMSLADIRTLCVDAFPQSKRRAKIMAGLETVVSKLNSVKIKTEVWVDGSFLTQKQEPEDVDIVLCTAYDVYDNGTSEQKQVLEWINDNLKNECMCDSYIHWEYPESHELHATGQFMRAYWMKQYGFSRNDKFKGVAVIELGGEVQ